MLGPLDPIYAIQVIRVDTRVHPSTFVLLSNVYKRMSELVAEDRDTIVFGGSYDPVV